MAIPVLGQSNTYSFVVETYEADQVSYLDGKIFDIKIFSFTVEN